jgi:hypothetical protein
MSSRTPTQDAKVGLFSRSTHATDTANFRCCASGEAEIAIPPLFAQASLLVEAPFFPSRRSL